MANNARREQSMKSPEEAFGTRAANHARQLLTEEVTQRVANPVKELGKLSQALRSTSAKLDGSFGAPYVGRAADQIDHFTDLLQHADAREVVEKVEGFARAQPIAFLGGAFVLGLSVGRFLKSSAQAAPSAELTSTKPRALRAPSATFQSTGNEP